MLGLNEIISTEWLKWFMRRLFCLKHGKQRDPCAAQRFWATTLSNVVHMDEVIAEHDEIIEALESGDKQRAADAARAHIFSFKRALLST